MTHKMYWAISLFVILVIAATTYKVISNQQEIAEIERDIAKQIARQSSAEQLSSTETQTIQKLLTQAPVESPNPETPTNDTTQDKNEITEKEKTKNDNGVIADPVRMSPHGFGPYPEIPAGALIGEFNEKQSVQQELLARVLVKLWNDGDRHLGGWISGETGKVYPHYSDVIYIQYEMELNELTGENETKIVKANSSPSTSVDLLTSVLAGNRPAGYKLIDIDETGINPFEFLDLPK